MMSPQHLPHIHEGGQWPTFAISTVERRLIATPVAGVSALHGNAGAGTRLPVASHISRREWGGAIFKGAALGIGSYALFYGFYLNRGFWLSQWHWAFLLAGMLVTALFIRYDRMLLLLVGIGLWYSHTFIIHTPPVFGIWVIGGVIIRLLYEALP